MEETLEEKVPMEVKVPDNDQGGIRRKLRDRDLLRKRRAEAEERATNQAESRKRARREPTSTPRKKGRPRKNVEPEHPEHSENQDIAKLKTPTLEEETGTESAPTKEVPAPTPAPGPYLSPSLILSSQLSALVPAQVSTPIPVPTAVPTLPQIPAVLPASTVLPLSYVHLETKATGEASHEVLIEDLGPDEEEDKLLHQRELTIDQGGVEETSAGVPETIKGFSESVSPPLDTLPGNMI